MPSGGKRKGAGRPKSAPTKNITFRVPIIWIDEIRQLVKERMFELRSGRSIDAKQFHIAVISFDTQDFQDWKLANDLKGDGTEHKRQFSMKNNTYYCITNVCDLRSLSIDEVIETDRANENEQYDKIKIDIRYSLLG